MQNNLFKRIQRIDHLICIKGTGTAADLAKRIGISRAQVYQYINLMRENGAPIQYDAFRETFYYSTEGAFIIQFKPKIEASITTTAHLIKTA